ncbi:MAG: hypothetical protein AUF67_03505 [Acidobacteria bacterium 13_1_20CM_58_21]|nr:MAG: hypothetical protein AUF67_03505 [Acidobacteria bacterium 13_1_20CM_58_21]
MISTDQLRSQPLASSGNSNDAIVPFNVLETRNQDLCRAFSWIFHADPLAALRRALQEWTQVEDVSFAPSGESAIAQILSLLPQQEVVMPAWICHQVKIAVRVAGKRITYVDLCKGGINATSAEYAEVARPGRILLIAHLFGVPTDVAAICELAKKRDCVTIEDAVPAVGGRQDGRLFGTFADFGVFSFEQSKRIPALRGGFIVANNRQLIAREKLERFRVVETSSVMPVLALAKAFTQNLATNLYIYRALTAKLLPLRPLVWRALRAAKGGKVSPIPLIHTGDGQQVESNSPMLAPRNPFYTREIHPYQAKLALPLIMRIEKIAEKIARLAAVYVDNFRDTPIAMLLPHECDMSSLMRFPIAFPGKARSQILRRAQKQSIHLKVMWSEEANCEGLPNSLWIARNLVLLPLYTALSERSAECLARTLVEIDRSTPLG